MKTSTPRLSEKALWAGLEALLQCTQTEVESYSVDLLDGYKDDVERVFSAVYAELHPQKTDTEDNSVINECLASIEYYESQELSNSLWEILSRVKGEPKKVTSNDILIAAENAGLLPNSVHMWELPLRRFTDEILRIAILPNKGESA